MSIVRLAIIGGTGLSSNYSSAELETVETRYGDVAVRTEHLTGFDLCFIARHAHGHTIPPHRVNHHAHVEAMRLLDVQGAIGTAAVGSLRSAFKPGDFSILSDFIDITRGAAVSFYDTDVKHTDFTEPYDQRMREALRLTAPVPGEFQVHDHGIYVCVTGPRYETPSEIKLFQSWGGDMVGMTNAPEAILCREAAIPYAGLAVVTNYGCGMVVDGHTKSEFLSHISVGQVVSAVAETLGVWMVSALTRYLKDFLI